MKEAADLLTRLESLPQAIRARLQIPSDFTSFMACARYYSARLRPALERPPVRGLPWAWLKVSSWLRLFKKSGRDGARGGLSTGVSCVRLVVVGEVAARRIWPCSASAVMASLVKLSVAATARLPWRGA